MKISEKDAKRKTIDDSLTILSLFDGSDFSFDVVVGVLNGEHPLLINKVSDRAYYILNGFGEIIVSDNVLKVSQGDLVVVKSGDVHGLNGEMKYLIITSPPFDASNEELV